MKNYKDKNAGIDEIQNPLGGKNGQLLSGRRKALGRSAEVLGKQTRHRGLGHASKRGDLYAKKVKYHGIRGEKILKA